MTSAVVSCRLQAEISAEDRKDGLQAIAVYFVEMDNPTVGPHVIQECQKTQTAPNHTVQQTGQKFNITVDGVTYSEALSTIYRDMEVDSITANLAGEGAAHRLKWIIRVVYRNPSLLIVVPDQQVHPTERAPKFWTESIPVLESRDVGKNLEAIRWPWNRNGEIENDAEVRPVGTLGPVTNGAGHVYGPLPTRTTYLPVFVYQTFALSPFTWIPTETNFKKTRNKVPWDVFGRFSTKVSPKTCAYLRADSSRPMYFGTTEYFEIEIRVLYNPEGHNIKVRNVGDKFWVSRDPTEGEKNPDPALVGVNHHVLETDFAGGLPVQPPIILSGHEKRFAPVQGFDILEFEDLKDVDYAGLGGA